MNEAAPPAENPSTCPLLQKTGQSGKIGAPFFQQRNTLKLAHIVFSSASVRKRLTHGNLAWQPVLVECMSRNDNSPHDPFVSLLMFLHVFRSAFSQGLRDFWRLMQPASAKPGALDRPLRSVSASKNFPLDPNNELKREITAQLVKFCEKQPTAKNLRLRCNSLSSVISVSLTTPQIYRTTLSQNTHCEMNRDLSHVHRCWPSRT